MGILYPTQTAASHKWWLRGIKTQWLLYGILAGFILGMVFGTLEERSANHSFVESVVKESKIVMDKLNEKNLSLREALGDALGRRRK